MDVKKLPIAEIFTSWQGEGLYSGCRMTFIRFAGCNVGKPIKGEIVTEFDSAYGIEDLPQPMRKTEQYDLLPIWQEECTTWDGRKFLCDTNFQKSESLTADEILDRIPNGVKHICLTGGEPLIHNLHQLISEWFYRCEKYEYENSRYSVHIETSGTKFPKGWENIFEDIWITVSPKFACQMEMFMRANEVKLLVDDKFNEELARNISTYCSKDCIVWLSPINETNTINKDNMKKCLELLERNPSWRITNQSHKLWGVR